MKPDTPAAGIPDVLLERYALGELSPADRADLERLLREDERLRHRLHAIELSDNEMRERDFPAWLARQVQNRPAPDTGPGPARNGNRGVSRSFRRWALPAAVGAAALLLVAIASRPHGPRSDSGGDRIKGLRPSLTVFRQTPAGSETLADGVAAREGDVVRLAYQAAGRTYGVIVSIDGRGGVTVHLPPSGREAARLRSGDKVLLDNAYELDDAPRWECFYFVTGQAPFDATAIVDAAKREAALKHPPAPLALPRDLEQSMFVLQKEHRP